MSIQPPIVAPQQGLPLLPLRRFSVDEYHRMIQAGILTEDDPVELLEGWIVQKMPHNPPHDGTIQVVNRAISRRLPETWETRIQSVVTTGDSEPELDVAVVPGPTTRFLLRHPGPADVALLIEVADSTLAADRQDKGRLYARAGFGCYWIINLPERQLEVYTDPTGPDPSPVYRRRQDFRPGDTVPLMVEGNPVAQIPVRELLP